MEIKYNHDRTLKEFQKSINKIKKVGFNPIAVTQMYFEDTFVFETDAEAKLAYETLEDRDDLKQSQYVIGWWRGKKDFLNEVEEYEAQSEGIKVKIYWLNEKEK